VTLPVFGPNVSGTPWDVWGSRREVYDPVHVEFSHWELAMATDEIGQPLDELAVRRGRRPGRPTE
jgi:hypothetical protein